MDIDFSPAVDALEDLVNDFIDLLPNVLIALVVFILFWAVGAWIHFLVRRFLRRAGRQRNVGIVLGRVSQWAILVIGLLVALAIIVPNFSPSKIVELLGIGTVAIGFAFRDILQNYLAGILILLTEPFRIGDQIISGPYEGTVEEIYTRATTIRTYNGRRVVIPNADLVYEPVIVNTAFEERRLEYDLPVSYSADIDSVKHTILEAVRGADDNILEQPAPDVLVWELTDSGMILRVRWWVQPPRRSDVMDARDKVLRAIKQSLFDQDVALPFPTQRVLVENAQDGTTLTDH